MSVPPHDTSSLSSVKRKTTESTKDTQKREKKDKKQRKLDAIKSNEIQTLENTGLPLLESHLPHKPTLNKDSTFTVESTIAEAEAKAESTTRPTTETESGSKTATTSETAATTTAELSNSHTKESQTKQSECIAYLMQWHTSKEQWKFNKNKQAWLMLNLFQSDRMKDTEFDVMKRYIKKLRGIAKENCLKLANEVLVGQKEDKRAKSVVKILSKKD